MRLTPSTLMLLFVLPAMAEDLIDSDYGDGSLVDQTGEYYYPQADGTYMDAYGNRLSPDSPGQLVDPLGHVLDLSPDSEAFATSRWKTALPSDPPYDDSDLRGVPDRSITPWSDATDRGADGLRAPASRRRGSDDGQKDDTRSQIAESVRKGIYMDVGTGYLDVGDSWGETEASQPRPTTPDVPADWSAPTRPPWASQPYPQAASEIPKGLSDIDGQPTVEEALIQRVHEDTPTTSRIHDPLRPFASPGKY